MTARRPDRPREIVRRRRPAVGSLRPREAQHRQELGVIDATRGPLRRRRTWMAPAVALGVLLLLGGAVLTAWLSPLFDVDDISVTGNQRVEASAIASASRLDGANMFTADLSAAQERVYALPLIKSVRIERSWPHGISIAVEERQVWGTWEQSGISYAIDREGVVLGTEPAPAGSPLIVSSEPGTRIEGDRVDYQAIEAAAELFEKLPAQLGTAVATVSFVAGKGIQVTTTDGQSALLGDSSSIGYKLAVWAAMVKRANDEHITYKTIDLRFGNRPVLVQ